jgi:hypothetical protein
MRATDRVVDPIVDIVLMRPKAIQASIRSERPG